jgi:hypothetical protein
MGFRIGYRWNRKKGKYVGPEEDCKHLNDFGKDHLHSLME